MYMCVSFSGSLSLSLIYVSVPPSASHGLDYCSYVIVFNGVE